MGDIEFWSLWKGLSSIDWIDTQYLSDARAELIRLYWFTYDTMCLKAGGNIYLEKEWLNGLRRLYRKIWTVTDAILTRGVRIEHFEPHRKRGNKKWKKQYTQIGLPPIK